MAAAVAKDQPQLTVEVLKAETVHPTIRTSKSDCDLGDASASCSSSIERAEPPERIPTIYRVNLLVRMPDGSTVEAECRRTTSLISMMTPCEQPKPGTYPAKINAHAIRLQIPVQVKPEYKRDGTLKKAPESKTQEVTFSFTANR